MQLDLASIIGNVPAQDGFLGPADVERRLSAVADRYPGLVRRERIGASREGVALQMATIGSGARSALVFAGPHPNEPVGFLTVPYLAELLCSDSGLRDMLGFTWHFIGCVDPDAARLNEGWYRGPLTREHYCRHMYRPPFHKQVEWTFPGMDGTSTDTALPETRSLMKVLDAVRPDLMCSLHNAEFGGMFYYLSDDVPGLADSLSRLVGRLDLPVHTGDAELPGVRRSSTGVFILPSHEQVREALTGGAEGAGVELLSASSPHYASQYRTLSLIIEVPLWQDPRSGDDRGCGERHADVLSTAADMLADIAPSVGRHIGPIESSTAVDVSPFAASLRDIYRTAAALSAALRGQAEHVGDGEATVAQQFALQQTAHTLRLRGCGAALRLLDDLALVDRADRASRKGLDDLFAAWVADSGARGYPVPLERLLAAQLTAILTAAAHLATTA